MMESLIIHGAIVSKKLTDTSFYIIEHPASVC